jgi:SAM-dependent methyltransferase
MISVDPSHLCRICGSAEHRCLFPVEDVNILECLQCGFRFPDQMPSSENLQVHYDEGYREPRFMHGQRVNARINRLVLKRLLGDLSNLKILDVGAGYGFLAHQLSQIKNSTCEAVEISQAQRMHARDVLGLRTFEDLNEVPGQYDLIVSFEVLEHISDPLPFLVDLSKLLKPFGSLILATDHFSSPTVLRMRSSFPKWVPHEHISCFSPASVCRLFDRLPSIDLVSLQTYASWELRLASRLFKIRQRFFANQSGESKCRELQHGIHLNSREKCGRERSYRFYRSRLILSPLLAVATLSPSTSGEMMIIHARKQA